jgi:hypothetical protein
MTAPWVLPPDLPPGRLVAPDPRFTGGGPAAGPVLWASDRPVPAAGALWARLRAEHRLTGLWPLLLTGLGGEPLRPWHSGELCPVPLPSAGERNAERVLAGLWRNAVGTPANRRDRGGAKTLPFGSWPGLARAALPPAGLAAAGPGRHADTIAASIAAEHAVYAGLIPASSGSEALAVCGWLGATNHARTEQVAIVIESWEQRFGARLVAAGFHTLELAVAFPPGTASVALRLAAEHYAFSPDNFGGSLTRLGEYADAIAGVPRWGFWWD